MTTPMKFLCSRFFFVMFGDRNVMPPRGDLKHSLSIISNYLIVRVDAINLTLPCINRCQVELEIANSMVLGVPERTKPYRGMIDMTVRLSGQSIEHPK